MPPPEDMSENRRYRIRPGFILREIAGEYAIIPVDAEGVLANAMLSPNETAVFLWKAFEHPATIDEVTEKAMAEYEGEAEEIRRAVVSFVADSLRYKMIEEVTEL